MAIDYSRMLTLSSRLCICLAIFVYSMDFFDPSGERNYNKYLHNLRK